MKRTDITRTIASLLITAVMLGVTGCGNVNTDTSSAPPKATTTASSTKASATTTTEATLTSQSEETTSLSATTTGTSASTKSTSSSKSSTTPKNTAKTNSSKASNGGTVNNGGQSYSHSTANNGSGNNSYSNDNNNSYQPQQTERQTEKQTERQTQKQSTTTAKKTQAPKPKPTTTTTAKPKFKLTQNDIDRLKRELQAYSDEIARPIFKDTYAECGYSSVDELLSDIGWMNLDNSSWGTPDTVSPDTYSSYDELYRKVKGHIDVLYDRIKYSGQVVIYTEWHGDGSAINSDGKPAWEIYLIY